MARREPASAQVRPPRQARSQATMERVLDATLAILDGRDFESIPLMEITEAANVSASSLYARFPTKRGLLRALHERHLARGRAMIDAAADNLRQSGEDLGVVLFRIVQLFLISRTTLHGAAATFRIAERHDSHCARRRREQDTYVMHLIRDFLIERLKVVDPVQCQRIELAVWSIAMAVVAAVDPPYRFVEHVGMDQDALTVELSRMGTAYLDLALGTTLTFR